MGRQGSAFAEGEGVSTVSIPEQKLPEELYYLTFLIPEKSLNIDDIKANLLKKLNDGDKEVFEHYLDKIKKGEDLNKLIHNIVGFVNYLILT